MLFPSSKNISAQWRWDAIVNFCLFNLMQDENEWITEIKKDL